MSITQALRKQRADDVLWGIVLAEVAKQKAAAQEHAERFYMASDDIVIDLQAQLQTMPRLSAHLEKYVSAIAWGPSWAQSAGLKNAPYLRTKPAQVAHIVCAGWCTPRDVNRYVTEVNTFFIATGVIY